MKLYCQLCGHGQTYASTKPKFCNQCGSPISIYSKTELKEIKNKYPRPQQKHQGLHRDYEFDESLNAEEDPENLNIGNMDSLHVDIDPLVIPRQTLGNIMKSQPEMDSPPKINEFKSVPAPEQSEEEFLESFKKEAGTQRREG